MSIPDLGIDFDRLASELKNDLGGIVDRAGTAVGSGLERITDVAKGAGSAGLGRITQAGSGTGNNLARIAGYGSYGGGGGGGLDFFEQLGGSNPFASFERAQQQYAPIQQEEEPPAGYPPSGGSGVGATGADPATDKWRDLIDQAAAEHGIDGDIIQAIMMIESGGNAGAVSAAGAQGLMQVMPFHFQPGENGMDPRTNVSRGAKVLSDNFKRWGSWDKAVAAYLGAIDGNGNIVGGDPYTGVSGNKYVSMFNENLARIKARRTTQPGAGYAGSAQGVASMYGGTIPPITQEFGRTDFSTGSGSDIYDFGSEMGLDGDSHTGWDVGSAVGTNFYMPAGLGGTVEIAGCTAAGCFYTDEQRGGGEGRGELRINLDNGMQLILGHNSAINVKPGQRVTAGMLLGQTGYANGAHQHVEVRVKDPSTRSGWRIVDPSVLFGNAR